MAIRPTSKNESSSINKTEDTLNMNTKRFSSTSVSAPKIEAETEAKKVTLDYVRNELIETIESWRTTHDSADFTGGQMRGDRGTSIEDLVMKTINKIAGELHIKLTCKKGSLDKKILTLPLPNGTNLIKEHQVDVHVYLNDTFIAVIECKAYLDSCYYDRACSDFHKFKKFGYNVKTLIFALEDSINQDTKIFTDVLTDNACDKVFYVLDGKRSSNKPVYDKRYFKTPNDDKIMKFIDYIFELITMKFD